MKIPTAAPALVALVLAACAAGCGQERGDVDPKVLLARGTGTIWLSSTETALGPKQVESRTLLEIAGRVTATDEGLLDAPADWRSVFPGGFATRSVTIRSEAGIDWKLGYRIVRDPMVDVTPAPPLPTGTMVRLRFRAIFAFGTAASFVLSDEQGVALAFDLGVYGDPFAPDDIPGLAIQEGASIGVLHGSCSNTRHVNLVFAGDAPVELQQNQLGAVAIKSRAYTAFHLFNFHPDPPGTGPTCPDGINEARAWALWR
jgi:hypothetical protein